MQHAVVALMHVWTAGYAGCLNSGADYAYVAHQDRHAQRGCHWVRMFHHCLVRVWLSSRALHMLLSCSINIFNGPEVASNELQLSTDVISIPDVQTNYNGE